MLTPRSLLFLTLLLLPSSLFLWHNSDMPHFGDVHDDSLYYVSAKSLANGHYNITSLPGEPYQTKYPPLYPLLLSIAWRLDPHFPQNLSIAAWLTWLAFPAMLLQLVLLYPKLGLDGPRTWILIIAIAVNPYFILFSSSLLSEMLFTALMLTSLLLFEFSEKEDVASGWMFAAGVMGGVAFLARSAGMVLLGSAVLYLWWRKKPAKALAFAAGMFPIVAAWMLWSRLHQAHTNDPNLIYYVDYLRYQIINYSPGDLHIFLWKNTDELLTGLGSIVIPKVTNSQLLKILSEVIAVAMISGIVRMVKRGQAVHYALFSAFSILMLMIWHFPANERYVLPIVPLAMAGLLVEMEFFWNLMRAGLKHPDRSQRVAGVIMMSLVASIFLGSFALQFYVDQVLLPQSIQQHRLQNIDHRGAYAWMKANLPAQSIVLAYNDPVLHLYSGLHASSRILAPALWYKENHDLIVDLYRNVVPWARDHSISYVYFTDADLRRDWGDEDRETVEKSIRSNPDLIPVYSRGISTVYQVRPLK